MQFASCAGTSAPSPPKEHSIEQFSPSVIIVANTAVTFYLRRAQGVPSAEPACISRTRTHFDDPHIASGQRDLIRY